MAEPIETLKFRKATPDDTERIAEIIHGDPGQEAVRMCGSVERARAMGYELVRIPGSAQGWDRSVVGELGGEVVVVLQAGQQIGGIRVTPKLALQAIRILGPLDAIGLLPKIRAASRVNAKGPADAYYIAELHVHPDHRDRGIGGAALDYAEAEARQGGYAQMALTVTTVNPARRLYERHGFRVVETRSDPAYERYTGIPGRHLMVKDLA
jgi:ribosomal protein S18 acetylase RimI-like enzyme